MGSVLKHLADLHGKLSQLLQRSSVRELFDDETTGSEERIGPAVD